MISGTIAFIAGILTFLYLPPGMPAWQLSVLLLCAGLLPFIPGRRRLPVLFAMGLLWCWWRVAVQLDGLLPEALDGADVPAEVAVSGIPRPAVGVTRFEARVVSLDPRRPWQGTARLSWYASHIRLAPGDRWLMTVRLRRPRGFANPGTFDFERWLFIRGIQATGYPVTRESVPRRIARGAGGLANLRLALARRMETALAGGDLAGLVVALGVGIREGISEDQWDSLRRSGTAHLMAISGLHVGLVAAMAYGLGGLAWRRSSWLCRHVPAPRAAALAALSAALGYALLAGFALPTRRAFIMVLALTAGALSGRNWPVSGRLAWAAMAVVLLDPLAVLGAGFWLSFGAVTLILLGMGGRLMVGRHPWWRWGRVHLLVGLGLAPIGAGTFGLASLMAPLANLVAVPWVGFVVVPLTLSGLIVLPLFPLAGGLVLETARLMLTLLWPLLEGLGNSGLELLGTIPPAAMVAAVSGVILLFAPAGLGGRWLGLLWLLPLFLAPRPAPRDGVASLVLLDVGQGLTAVVRTAAHVLVYDTGPRFRYGTDSGRTVLVPYLRSQGLKDVDTVVVSHGDSDHAGGFQSLREELPVRRVLWGGGDPADGYEPCRRGQNWRWDGVDFRVLHPAEPPRFVGNDASCVLAVSAGASRLILSGDLERAGEAALVGDGKTDLAADVLLIPHHGSRTSSTPGFIRAVAPELGLLSVGYRNRFRFPHKPVLRRLEKAGVRLVDTAACGAISVDLTPTGPTAPKCFRRDHPRLWRAR